MILVLCRSRFAHAARMTAVFALFALCLAPLGGGRAGAADAVDRRPAIVFATAAVPDTLDPDKSAGTVGVRLAPNLYDTLLSLNPQAGANRPRYIPGLATSWHVSDDGLSADFQLRKAFFHNGAPVTADDVKFSLERAISPKTKNPFVTYFANLASVEVLSPTSVRLHFSRPWIGMLDGLAARGQIIPKAYLEQVGDDGFAQHPIGSGPFMYVDRQIGDSVTFKAFDQYWAGKPAVAKVVWRAIPDPNSRVSLLTSGGADIITDVPGSLVESIRASGASVNYLITPTPRFVQMNSLKGGPLADKRVRMALNLALDRKPIFHSVFERDVEFIDGPLSPEQIGGNAVKHYPYDPKRAKALLAEAGFPNGFATELVYPAGRYPGEEELLPALASYWKRIGVDVTLRSMEYSQWLETARQKTYPGMLDFSKADFPVGDPFSAFDRHVRCGGSYSAYCNKELDALVDSANGIVDEAQLQAVFRKAQTIAHDDAQAIFMFREPGALALRKGLQWRSDYTPDCSIGWYVVR
jgi:peptide/nickel transport system substrate-binding protein